MAQPIRCRALVCHGPKKLSVEDIIVEAPRADEVRIKILASGVCHTDAHVVNGDEANAVYPVILGHEGFGVVESVGSAVRDVAVGDKVIPLYCAECGKCGPCKDPRTNLCDAITATHVTDLGQKAFAFSDGKTPFRLVNGEKLVHNFMGTSTLSEYTVVKEANVTKVNPNAKPDAACLIGCQIVTGFGAVQKVAKVASGSTCAVLGLGGVGLAAVQACKLNGASRIIGVDINKGKFDQARFFGCTDVFDPSDYKTKSVDETILEMTNGVGVDYSFEAIGDQKTFSAALGCVKKGTGVAVLLGLAPSSTPYSIMKSQLIGTQRTLTGCYGGAIKGKSELPKFVDLYVQNKIKVNEYVTHRLPLDKAVEGFACMEKGTALRSVVVMDPKLLER